LLKYSITLFLLQEKSPKKQPQPKKAPIKESGKRQSRSALRTLNTTPPPSPEKSSPEKERLLESLQLSPSKVPPRVPEPTISLSNPAMKLFTCEWSGSSAKRNLPPVDRSYSMTISVEADEGQEMDICLAWNQPEIWDSNQRTTEQFTEQDESSDEEDDGPPGKRARMEDSSFGKSYKMVSRNDINVSCYFKDQKMMI
jgi:hypothetical protein